MVEILLCLLFAVLLGGKTPSRKGNSRQGWHGGASWNSSLSREVLIWGVCSGTGGIWWGHLSTWRFEGLEQEQRGWKIPRESTKQISHLSVGGYVVFKAKTGFRWIFVRSRLWPAGVLGTQSSLRGAKGQEGDVLRDFTILSSIFIAGFIV